MQYSPMPRHYVSGETLLNILFDLQPTTVYDMITQLQQREDLAEYGYQIATNITNGRKRKSSFTIVK